MYSVLINAVLSSSPDYGLLFESLCWPSDSWPGTERVEALTAFIEGLGPLMADSNTTLSQAKKASVKEQIESVIWTQCLPLLSTISAEAGEGMRCRESTAAACRLVSVCVPLCDEAVPGRVALSVLPSLRLSEEEAPGPGRLGVEVASEVMAALIPSLSADEQLTLTTLSSALSCIKTLPDALVSKITVRLLLTLLNCCSGASSGGSLGLILDDLCSWHSADRTPGATERALLCLTALSDHLLKPHSLSSSSSSSSSCEPRLSVQFWRLVQDGLTHRDSVSRKRALYLLKKCVALSEEEGVDCPLCPSGEDEILFRWASSRSKLLREFWEDYALVMETLEENQVHVVRPVLNRIDTLIQTTVNDSQASGQSLFHPSWLLCVYQRMFHSENKSLMREGVCHLLELQVLQQPDFALAFSQFIVGPFMDVLSETSLFQRSLEEKVGDCPELGAKLQVFVATFFSSLPPEHRGRILLHMIQQLCSKHWCAVPLLFLSQALSRLPPSPLLGLDGLTAVREVLRCTMVTHQVLLRGAAQCFLLNSALSLTDVSAVTLDDVFSFLMDFRSDESLCRGTQIWNQTCAWLLENEGSLKPRILDGDCTDATTKKETVRSYVQSEIHAYLRVPASTGHTERLPDLREADKLARAILLCVDMERNQLGAEISNTLESLLSPLLDTLSRVSTNIYLPLRKSDKSLQLVLRLFQLGGTPSCQHAGKEQVDSVMVAMKELFYKLVDPIQEFILRRLFGELQELFDVERAELYLCVLRQLAVMYSSAPQHHNKIQQTYFPKLIKYSLKVLQEPNQQIHSVANQVARAVAMASLATVCGLVEQEVIDMRSETISVLKSLNDYFYNPVASSSQNLSSLENFNKRLQRPQTGDGSSDVGVQGPLLQDWGRIAANFMRDQWICLSFLIKAVGIPESVEIVSETLKVALSCSVEALALLPSDLVLPVLTFMETVLPQLLLSEEALCVEAVTLSWELVQDLSTNAHDFWLALKGFVSMAFHHKLLELTDTQAPTLVATLKQISTELMELSQSKSGVFGVLLQHCCQTWLPTDQGSGDTACTVFSSVFSHINILTEACVYGPVFRRDQRLIQDVQTYVEQLGEECSANVAVTSDDRDDQLPRTCVLAFLSRLDSSNLQHERLIEEIVMDLLKKDNDISKSKVRYYSNSLQHRVKNRVWQILLLLLPKLREEFVATFVNRVFEAGFCSNQASVKYLIEWMMILILVHYPQHMDSFWACFNMDHEKTKTSSCTFLSVLVHFNVIIPNLTDEAVQLRKALDIILQWCFNHNFSVRLYALLALKRVWSLAEARAKEGADGLGGLSTVIKACLNQAEAMQSTGNANKNWMRIQEHFFFGAFHPIRDYSAETIFYTFPSLSELADDEWIPPWKFEKLSYFSVSPSFPLRNTAPDLSQLQPGDWIQQDKGEQNKEDRWAEVQKKITPWRLGIQEQEPELQLVPQQRAARLGRLHGALLVVASLIDKPTNLGGLCRTCEIFGASALVLDSLRHVSDKHFQSLSVSSELWLPLLEVKPMELTDFLQLKKSEGYCIVGVEQTANSQSLKDYKFPEKSLLLLGNEREGIPANLLQMLDVCVEIPQQGVIRSLNVHVSAALLIWEYTRQHLTSGSTKSTQNTAEEETSSTAPWAATIHEDAPYS
ncbi:LOW QUALITY PROTEIN: probable methyltransferase TARBP1 [Morone saxatilis]|uniref:LOW QUALITY PROTEIN: probable methyltransferase TARBP1 n=1 Tax=Morone saxatilis TaxID=34816 RepID=UPI0015E1D706|nr:LOW QUALITY PROTEIN: probable methyltransferase TARBP1 [Morone saxatilis]